jgi:hypothetical protein
MPLPILLALTYLLVNLALTIWIEREREAGRVPPGGIVTLSTVLRWGPPIAGFIYVETVAGDWLFFIFVLSFFALAFYLLDRALNFPSDPPKRGRS